MRASSDLSDLSSYWKDQRSAHRRMGVVKSVVLGRVVHGKVLILIQSKMLCGRMRRVVRGGGGGGVMVCCRVHRRCYFGLDWLLSNVCCCLFLSLSGLGKHESDEAWC